MQEFVFTLSNCSTRIRAFISVVYVITSGLKSWNMREKINKTFHEIQMNCADGEITEKE